MKKKRPVLIVAAIYCVALVAFSVWEFSRLRNHERSAEIRGVLTALDPGGEELLKRGSLTEIVTRYARGTVRLENGKSYSVDAVFGATFCKIGSTVQISVRIDNDSGEITRVIDGVCFFEKV